MEIKFVKENCEYFLCVLQYLSKRSQFSIQDKPEFHELKVFNDSRSPLTSSPTSNLDVTRSISCETNFLSQEITFFTRMYIYWQTR